jgi:hypothetical protein
VDQTPPESCPGTGVDLNMISLKCSLPLAVNLRLFSLLFPRRQNVYIIVINLGGRIIRK